MEKIYIQITSGRGPVECCRVVMFITKKMIEQIKGLGYEVEIVEHEDGPEYGCMFSVTLSVEGENIMSLKDEWEGSVLWVAQKNPFRPWHRRKNWFVGVHFFSPLQPESINERDITYETLRASGPGGQNVNKVETGVRLRYMYQDPDTGEEEEILIANTESRKQQQNRENAMRLLKSQLYDRAMKKRMEAQAEIEASKLKIEWGSQIRSYVFDDRRVKDHRTGYQTTDVDAVMDGKLDGFIKAYLMALNNH
jgi:peptide chain release factor 2